MKIIETVNLSVGHDHKTVVADINLEVRQGQLIAVLGPNGAGKSTILKSLAALLAPIQGAIYIQGQELTHMKRRTLSTTLAVVLTERLNAGFLTAFEVAAMGRYPHTGFLGKLTRTDQELVWECLRIVNALNIAERYFNQLSDGEKQKVMLARALAQEPSLIILDEPTTHLDVKHKLDVMTILRRLSREKGITVIFSLHEIDLALKSCDLAILVKDGKIMRAGSPEKLSNHETFAALFDIECAGFSAFMGTMEISNRSDPSVFVVGGAGMATGVYRMLTKNNVGFYTGILHENDVDCYIAETMGVVAVKEKPFRHMGQEALAQAQSLLKQTRLVVDAGCPIEESNLANQRLVLDALQAGQRVCTLRDDHESRLLYGNWADKMLKCRIISDILPYCAMARCPST